MNSSTLFSSRFGTFRSTAWFLLLALFAHHAFAATFDIPEQSAATALRAFAKQAKVDVLFSSDELKPLPAHAVKGDLEPLAALQQLLEGTGCDIKQTTPKNFVVTMPEAAKPGSIDGEVRVEKGGRPVAGAKVALDGTDKATLTDKRGRFRFDDVPAGAYALLITADGVQNTKVTDVTVANGHRLSLSAVEVPVKAEGTLALDTYTVSAKKNDGAIELDPYAVTGTKPQPFSDRNVDLPRTINDVQPYYIFDSRKIEESGTTTVEEFLRQRLTMDTTVMTNSQMTRYTTPPTGFSGRSGSGWSNIDLNGLGADHTIILVNGVPMPGVAYQSQDGPTVFNQADVNGIPLGAIDRIEVLPSSAGAIYGAGAEGGVINIILKKAYSGGDISATYAGTWDGNGPSRTISANLGKSFENGKTQFFLSAQYADSAPMIVADRVNLLNRAYDQIRKNDPSYLGLNDPNLATQQYSPVLGATPNIASTTTYTAVPTGTIAPAGASLIKNRAVGSYFNGVQVTAANPWILATPPQPLTLKSSGVAVGGANPYIATLPSGFSATSNPAGIIGGQWNLAPGNDDEGPNGLLVPLGNYSRRKSITGTVTRQMTDTLQLHFDFSHSEDHAHSTFNNLFTQNGKYVPATAPINPFNQSVLVSIPVNLGSELVSNTASDSITLGGTLKLPRDWIAHFDYQWSRSRYDQSYLSGVNSNAFATAPTFFGANSSFTYLGTPDLNPTPFWTGAINPFVDTLAYPADWAQFESIFSNNGKNISNEFLAAAAGPIFRLPWGEPRLSVRLEHNETRQPAGTFFSLLPEETPYPGLPSSSSLTGTTTSFGSSQARDNASAELDLPIFKSKMPLLRQLDMQFNFRTEMTKVTAGTSGIITYPAYAYGTYPNGAVFILGPNTVSKNAQPLVSYTNQSGVMVPASGAAPYRFNVVNHHNSFTGPAFSYKPFEDVLIRASIANGYVAPGYSQLVPLTGSAVVPTTVRIVDPKNPNAGAYQVTAYNIGGNPSLQPQTSKSWNAGIIWEPHAGVLRGLRLDVEYSETNQFNLITDLGAQGFVNFENAFPGHVVRDTATGLVTSVTDQLVNTAAAKQKAWTVSLDYDWRTPIGSFEFNAAETIQEHNQRQLAAGSDFLEYVGYPNSGGLAKTKATGTLRWAFRNWVAAWTAVYYGGYKQYGAPGDPADYQGLAISDNPDFITSLPLDTVYTAPQGGDRISSQIYHNLYLSYAFPKELFDRHSRYGRAANALLNGMRVSLVVNNVLNKVPSFDAYYYPFYTSPYGDVQLRNYAITLKKSF